MAISLQDLEFKARSLPSGSSLDALFNFPAALKPASLSDPPPLIPRAVDLTQSGLSSLIEQPLEVFDQRMPDGRYAEEAGDLGPLGRTFSSFLEQIASIIAVECHLGRHIANDS